MTVAQDVGAIADDKTSCLPHAVPASLAAMKRRSLLALPLAALSLTSCKDMTRGVRLADAAVDDFHKRFNEQKFKEIYADAHADLKSATTEADFVKLLEAVHRKLGKHTGATGSGWRINSLNMKSTVVFSENSVFEQGKGTEVFTFVISGESCVLQGYDIESRDMMLK